MALVSLECPQGAADRGADRAPARGGAGRCAQQALDPAGLHLLRARRWRSVLVELARQGLGDVVRRQGAHDDRLLSPAPTVDSDLVAERTVR